MYAVINDRGRQYRAAPGERLTLDRSEAGVGTTLEMPVLLLADDSGIKVGAPVVAGAKAVCKVVAHERGDKGIVGKYKRRKHSRKRMGFRHEHTIVEVVSISG
jgi:large subunit ribosomal protein L21